ncbi:MAG TPA: VIT domain-containing protein [Gemmataceae bacterium]|nr:VIT domain-containing protein [Gemmataceae bacterium]
MFNPQAYENSRPDGIGVLEIAGGEETDQPRRFVPLRQTDLKGEVVGPLAALRLTQTFGYTREQCDQVLEALYRFPLPGDAAVTAVRVRFGDVEIRTELKERGKAEAEYDKAKQQGRQAALVTRESPDVFTLQVAGIQPGQDITIETSYVQLARAEGPGWSLRIPLTTSPRYVRSDEQTSRHAQGQPLFLLRDPGHRFSLDLGLCGAGTVQSPTHRLDVTREGQRLRVRLQEGEVLPDRDCVLSWRPAQEADRPSLQVLLHDDRGDGQVYFLALATPPATRDPGRGVPREVILLVDHSGSMEGPKWQAADWAVEKFLSELSPRDSFALGLFHDKIRWFAPAPRQADPGTVREAVEFLKRHRDSGGTELGVALEQALHQARAEGEVARHVLIITDAAVSDAGRILRLADQEAARADRRRISVLCIDAAPNSLLANELAERGGGLARFLTSRPEEEDITTALDEVLADWSEPVLAGLRLEMNRPQAEAAGRDTLASSWSGWSAIDLGDLPAGRPVWVAGRVPRGGSRDLTFRVIAGRNWEVASCRLDLQEADARPALKALFGARRVRGLEYLIHSGYEGDERRDQLRRLGYDPDQILTGPSGKKVYAENARAETAAALRDLLVRESLHYGLISAETAFIATRTEAGKPVEGTVAVANALPAGWSEHFAGGFVGGLGGVRRRVISGSALSVKSPGPMGFFRAALARSGMASADLETASEESFMGLLRAEEMPAAAPAGSAVLFAGTPRFAGGEAVLFDSAAAPGQVPERATIDRLQVRFPDGAPDPASLDPGLCLLIFVDDLASPRARARLADVVRQRGERPLNLLRLPGQVVRLVLVDPAGAWAKAAPRLEVALGW